MRTDYINLTELFTYVAVLWVIKLSSCYFRPAMMHVLMAIIIKAS